MTNVAGFRMLRLKRIDLERLRNEGRTTDIDLVGMVYVDEDVTPDLIDNSVSSVRVFGRIIGTPQVRKSLLAKQSV